MDIEAAPVANNGPPIDPHILKIYYDRVFPVGAFFKWLNYGDAKARNLTHREFSFTLKDDIYIRYCSFATKEEFKDGLVKKLPYKIDIGAVYNAPPKIRQTVQRFLPEEKELVFDIDMTDYDDVRTCCSGASICMKCWPLMTAAVKVIDLALRQDFGFKHLLWVYSGRRGIHCWVCDKKARVLSNRARTAVVDYLSVYMGNADSGYKNLSSPLHPSLQRAYSILLPFFKETCIGDQGVLGTEESCQKILDMIDKEIREEFEDILSYDGDMDGMERWEALTKKAYKNNKSKKFNSARLLLPQKIVFTHIYPRLDANVSKQLNHLLKSPFCIHPKTGRVCVPMDPSTCEDFNPFDVPTLHDIHDQLNKKEDPSAKTAMDEEEEEEEEEEEKEHSDGRGKGSKKGISWRKTSLRSYIEGFQLFVKPLHHAGVLDGLEQSKNNSSLDF